MAGAPVNSHVISTAPTILVNNNLRQPGPGCGALTDTSQGTDSSTPQQLSSSSSMAEQQQPPPLQPPPDPPQPPVQATLSTSSPQQIILANRSNLSQVILTSRPSGTASPATTVAVAANVSVNTSNVVNTQTCSIATRQPPPIINGPVRLSAPTNAPLNVQTMPQQPGQQPLQQQSTSVPSTSQTQLTPNQSQPQQVLVSNPNMQQVFLTTRPGQVPQVISQQRNLAPRPQIVLNGPALRHPGPQATVPRQSLPLPLISQGLPVTLPPGARPSILIKTDQGYQLLNIQPPVQPSTGGLPQMIRLQMPVSSAAGTTQQTPIRAQTSILHAVNLQPQQPHAPATTVIRTSTPSTSQPLSVSTTQANAQAAQGAVPNTQMSPSTAKKKCKKFLSTLIKLANDQPEEVSANVKRLIQGLIDGTIIPEDFTNELQRELRSSEQPCLVPFLKKSLPHLRHSLAIGELEIEGVNPPPRTSIQLQQTQSPLPQFQFQVTPSGARQPIRFVTPMSISGPINLPAGSLVQRTPLLTTTNSLSTVTVSSMTNSSTITSTPQTAKVVAASKAKPKPRTTSTPKEKKISTSLREDDDINDVAAMGGVNLQEESQRMAASANEVGVQIRSCKDETFLFTTGLTNRINRIASKYNLEETSTDVVALVSHAAQERLKDLVEKLGVIAEHRLENIKLNPRYEITQDVRGQVKFLEELDKQEKKRHEEQEREMLLRAAKSRSKLEDPEQLKLKQKAKEMQRAEMEEARQREANETALLAIGPRKKLKTGDNGIAQSSSGLANHSHSFSNHFASPFTSTGSSKPIRRVKRVSMKDMLFLMEQDRFTNKSRFLYRAYAK